MKFEASTIENLGFMAKGQFWGTPGAAHGGSPGSPWSLITLGPSCIQLVAHHDLRYKVWSFYLKKCGFYGLGSVLGTPRGYPWGPSDYLWLSDPYTFHSWPIKPLDTKFEASKSSSGFGILGVPFWSPQGVPGHFFFGINPRIPSWVTGSGIGKK